MFGQMTQIQSYADQTSATVGNFFNPTHQITKQIQQKTDKIDFHGTAIIVLIGLVVLYIGVRK